MKHNLLTSALLLAALSVCGQNKMDLNVGLIVENYKARMLDNDLRPAVQSRAAQEDDRIAVMVDFAQGASNDAVFNLDGEVITRMGDVAVVSVPVANLEALSQSDDVVMLSLNTYEPTLVNSRTKTNADVVLEGTGEGLDHAFLGDGVIAGIFDTGIDPNHVNFFNDDLSENRFKAFFNYIDNAGRCAAYTTPDAIKNFTSDNRGGTHGTHVCGIMAGSYKGNADFGLNGKAYTDQPNPYYGLAQHADIIGGAGSFTDVNMCAGLGRMIDYAQAAGKPLVVNFSIGGLIGPHDGTSSISRYFKEAGKKAIIVVAAGNDGSRKCAVTRKFNAANKTLRTVISGSANMQFWNSTDNRFKFEFVIYSTSTKDVVAAYEMPNNTSIITINSKTDGFGPLFAQTFTSDASIQAQGWVDNYANRFQMSVVANLPTSSSSSKLYRFGVRITGEKGETVTGFISNGEFSSGNITGWQDGTTNGSISDMSTGENVICVGSFTSGKSFSLIDGSIAQLSDEASDGVSTFSSYGVTNDGRKLPNLVGPGAAVISSYNSYCGESTISAKTSFNGRTYTWGQASGTSMACPFMSGTVALMLEAKPDLTVDEAREILTSTATEPPLNANSTELIQWGAGKVNVYRAIKKTLESAGVGQVWEDDSKRLVVNRTPDGYTLFVAGEAALEATLVDMQGRTIRTASAQGAEVTLSTADLTPGVYAVSVKGETSRYTKKLLVK